LKCRLQWDCTMRNKAARVFDFYIEAAKYATVGVFGGG
jgi:hypothetical protein